MTYIPEAELKKGVFQARMQRDSATQISLQRYKGRDIEINGKMLDPGAGGIAMATTDNRIDGTGADAGAALAALTLYYIYVSNEDATTFPSDLRASTVAPSLFNGVQYLGTSGNALNWRYVGMVYPNASTEFEDSLKKRFIANYYNRQRKPLQTTPAYVNDGLATSISFTSLTYAELNGGTDDFVEFITHGEDAVELILDGAWFHSLTTESGNAGIGRSSTSQPYKATRQAFTTANKQHSFSVSDLWNPVRGRHSAHMLFSTSAATLSVNTDLNRDGASNDPRCTTISGHVWL